MSYVSLSQKLKSLSELIEHHSDHLGGKVLAKAAKTFEGQAAKFEERIEDAVKGLTPEMRALEGFLTGPDKKHFTIVAIKMIYREAFGKTMSSDQCKTPATAKKNLLKSLKEAGSQKNAVEKAKEILGKAKAPRGPIPKDEEKLRLELNRLGGLDDDQLAFELENRYGKVADLKKLARANGISTPNGVKKADILKAVIERARRIHGHTFR